MVPWSLQLDQYIMCELKEGFYSVNLIQKVSIIKINDCL